MPIVGTAKSPQKGGSNEYRKTKKLIDKEFGKDAYICIYNKRNQFLCEGIVSALRKKPLWQLLDEENANVASMFSGTSENGKKAIIIKLSQFPERW